MTILVFDTETTGLHSKSSPLTDPRQPWLVQLSALQVELEPLRVVQSLSLIVRPDGWEIPVEAQEIHGISTEFAEAYGQDVKQVLTPFMELWLCGSAGEPCECVAHNWDFDKFIMSIALARTFGQCGLLDTWQSAQGFCTMNQSKRIVNAQTKPDAKGKTRLKNPKLLEAYEFFYGKPYDTAHTANADAVATLQVYLALREHKDVEI
jgi:DNA polymerase-3 subunit epsilon